MSCEGLGSSADTAVGSDESGEETAGVVEPFALELEGVSYELAWGSGTTTGATEGGWEVETDQGYVVRVHQAWTTMYSMSLIPCEPEPEPETETDWTESGFALMSSALVGRAWAGHPSQDDPSATHDRLVEDLTQIPDTNGKIYAQVEFERERYCQLHFVYGPANAETTGLPADVDLIGKSIYLVGSWRNSDDEELWTEFEIEASHADGRILDFAQADMRAAGDRVRLSISRDWRLAFDGIDLPNASAFDLNVRVLRNLAASATLHMDELEL